MIAQREITEGQECFMGNSNWLSVLNLLKTLVNSVSERKLWNSGKLKLIDLV